MSSFERYPGSPRIGIGPLQIDLERGTVSGLDGASGLTSRAEQLLLLLGRYPNLLVTREQILQTVWAGRVVEDAAITNCIWQIRKAIGERGKEVLQTRSKRGYVLAVADSDWILDTTPHIPDAPAAEAAAPIASTLSDDAVAKDTVVDHAAIDRMNGDDASIADSQAAASSRLSRWSLRLVAAIALAAIICGVATWPFLRNAPEPIVLRPDVDLTMSVLAPEHLDWLRAAVLRSAIENLYLHGSRVVLFQKSQVRNPFAGPHLQVKITRATKTDIDAELTIAQGSTMVRERFRGAPDRLAPAVQGLLVRTLGAAPRRSTPAVDALVSGWSAEQRFEHPLAIQEFRRAVARDPALNDAKIALASALLEQGQGNAALALIEPLLAGPQLNASQRCTLDQMLVEIAPERLQATLCDRASRLTRLGKIEMRELLREIGVSQAPKDARQWLRDEHAAVFALIRLGEFDEAEARLAGAQRTAGEAGWAHAGIAMETLRSLALNHQGKHERGASLQLESADAFEALGDIRTGLQQQTIGLRALQIVPGPDVAARRAILRATVERARAIGSVRVEIDAIYQLVRLDRGHPEIWRAELARIFDLLEVAYPPRQQTQDLHKVLNEMRIQHRYGEVLDGVMRIERAGGTQPQAQLWNLTLRAESHFARDELDQAVKAVDAMQRENFEMHDTNPCLFAWLYVEAQQPQRAREILGVCRSQQYGFALHAPRADTGLIAEARLHQRAGEADRAWPVLRPRIDALLGNPDLTLREAESLALLARHAVGLPGADHAQLQQALAIVEEMARLDGAGVELQSGSHLLRWRLCAASATAVDCGPVLLPSAPEDLLERRLAEQVAAK